MKRIAFILAGLALALSMAARGDTLTNYIYVYSTTNVVTTVNSNLYDATITTTSTEASNRFSILPGTSGMSSLGTPSFTNGVPYYPTTNIYYGMIKTDSTTYNEYRETIASNKWVDYPSYEYFTGVTLYPTYISIVLTQKTGSTVLILPQSRLKSIEIRDTSAVTFPYR